MMMPRTRQGMIFGEPEDPDLASTLGLLEEPSVPGFTGPDEGWPPRIEAADPDDSPVEIQPLPGSLTESLERELRAVVLRDRGVQEGLGRRFAYIGAHGLADKGQESHEVREWHVEFFSYEKNAAINVRVHRAQVV